MSVTFTTDEQRQLERLLWHCTPTTSQNSAVPLAAVLSMLTKRIKPTRCTREVAIREFCTGAPAPQGKDPEVPCETCGGSKHTDECWSDIEAPCLEGCCPKCGDQT